MKNLQLLLKTKWFEMTKTGIKTEDYREINEYWFKILVYDYKNTFSHFNEGKSLNFFDKQKKEELIKKIFSEPVKVFVVNFNKYEINKMTLGCTKLGYTERILKLEHKGIEIRTGNPEWGAEPNKLYFVIKHGEIIK